MNENKLTKLLSNAQIFAKEKSPEILTGLSVAGLVLTAVAAYKAGPKATKILEDKRKDMTDVAPGDKETKRAVIFETMKEMAPVMAPPIIMGVTTTACILGSHSISARRIAAVSAAYSLSEKAVNELNDKMVGILGEKKTREIKDAVVKSELQKQGPPPSGEMIQTIGHGGTLCKDMFSGRFFYSDAQRIQQAINDVSAQARAETYITVNDFYYSLGLEANEAGIDLGWTGEQTFGDGNLPIRLTALLTDNNEPCLCITFDGLKPV